MLTPSTTKCDLSPFRWEAEQVRRGATRPAAQERKDRASASASSFVSSSSLVANGGGGKGWGLAGKERPNFLGFEEMQKVLRETGSQLRESHERNERQLQMVRRRFGSGNGETGGERGPAVTW